MSLNATSKQIPDHAILDHFNKQVYLGNKFSATFSTTSSGTTETVAMLIQNTQPTNGTAKSLFIDTKKLSSLTASNSATLRCYINPTFSAAGSTVTPVNLRPANANMSTATLTSGPTVSANTGGGVNGGNGGS